MHDDAITFVEGGLGARRFADDHRPLAWEGQLDLARRAEVDDLTDDGERRSRVAVLRHETGAIIEPAIEAELQRTADALAHAGLDVVEGVVPDLRRAPEVWARLVGTELLQVDVPTVRRDVSKSALQHIEEMFGIYDGGPTVAAYVEAMRRRRAMARELAAWMEEFPIILAPVAGMATPPLDFDDFLDRTQTQLLFDHMRCVPWVNLLSLPGVALGNGTQIVARRFQDRHALHVARIARAALGPVSAQRTIREQLI